MSSKKVRWVKGAVKAEEQLARIVVGDPVRKVAAAKDKPGARATIEVAYTGGGIKNIPISHNMPAGDKIRLIRKGISKKSLTDIKTALDLDYDELSEVLSTSRATLINKKGNQKFDSQVSEKIVLLADIMSYGREVFGDNDNFNEWLKTSSVALGNVTPLSLMDTLYGIDEVKKELGRIDYGVY